MSPDEVLNMAEDRQILFISGKDMPPILGQKYPYFSRREMAGKYLNNPYHPPSDTVPVATRFGTRRRRIITEAAPGVLREFPQHADGSWSYVEGYRPHL